MTEEIIEHESVNLIDDYWFLFLISKSVMPDSQVNKFNPVSALLPL